MNAGPMVIDALAHLTPDGRWFGTSYDASVGTLLCQMDEAGVDRAAVVGLPGYIPNPFILDVCRQHADRLIPVASFDPTCSTSPVEVAAEARAQLLDHGFQGVKLHPRLNHYDPLDPRMFALLDELAGWPAPPAVWVCTLFHFRGGTLRKPPVESIYEIVGRYPQLRFVLAHGGGPEILRVAMALREHENAILDLSLTLRRFAGSSVELDIRSLLRTFDRRLVFGSDFPEASLLEVRREFERVAQGSKPGAAERVMGANLIRFLPGLAGLGSEGGELNGALDTSAARIGTEAYEPERLETT